MLCVGIAFIVDVNTTHTQSTTARTKTTRTTTVIGSSNSPPSNETFER